MVMTDMKFVEHGSSAPITACTSPCRECMGSSNGERTLVSKIYPDKTNYVP